MTKSKIRVLVTLVACVAVSATSCGVSDLLNAANVFNKYQSGQINTMTGDEIRSASALASEFLKNQNPPVNVPPLTPEQANALAAFFVANNIKTQADLDALAANAQNGMPPKGLAELAAAFPNVDPNNPNGQQLQQIFQQAFAGGGGA